MDAPAIAETAANGSRKRCAIYTRKSTEEGLEQGFNSLQAQREACGAYVASQRHEGWSLVPTAYDDGGYSGGGMERPGLQALLADIDAGKIDVVVVYKVDRLTRSLPDFARMVERFDRRSVSFVSVTQSFNTTSSMGRLTLNVLLSFAQFEREVGAERVRDKIAASRKKGIWMGGAVPLGYRAENRELIIDQEEAERVRAIFRLYLALGSTTLLLGELRKRDIRTANRQSRRGRLSGDVPFGTGSISYLLKNRTYIGEVVHKGEVYPGAHEPILARGLFDEVQARLASQAPVKRGRPSASPSLLTGLIFDTRGNRMSPAHAHKRGVRYRYYVSRALAEGRKAEAGDPSRVPAPDVEAAVLAAIREWTSDREGKPWLDLDGSDPVERRDQSPVGDDQALITTHLHHLQVHPRQLVLVLNALGSTPGDDQPAASGQANPPDLSHIDALNTRPPDPATETVTIPWTPDNKRPKCAILEGTDLSAEGGSSIEERRRLAHAIHAGRLWLNELATGSSQGIEAIANRESKHARTIRSSIALAFLAPDLVERLLDQGLPPHWTSTNIARGLPRLWADQRRMLQG